jgi:tagaturonate epimerase
MAKLGKYSFGMGDRFEQEAPAQLKALMEAQKLGIEITPVWNKSNREHGIVGTTPDQTRKSADNAVKQLNWKGSYFADADHINITNVDKFVDHCDFFTIDVADYIGKKPDEKQLEKAFLANKQFIGNLKIEGIAAPFEVTTELLNKVLNKFLFAIEEATKIYQHIKSKKGSVTFITEVSMDEVDEAQSPLEMFFILKLIADHKIPVDTIAPKFTGRFNKGVDYKGNLNQFEQEFEADLLVISHAVKQFGLPENLKLSIHSGSDKFSIYPIMKRLIHKYDKGIHLKTAGTTWLEEVIGLAQAGGEALEMAKDIYAKAFKKREELSKPYSTVIEIIESELPDPEIVKKWDSKTFVDTLKHIPENKLYNSSFRQLIHVGYKVAAELGDSYINMIIKNHDVVGSCVSENLLERHIKRIFI